MRKDVYKINESLSQEKFEVKNTYFHPRYRYGELHADIALIELGRRAEFKLDEFGDTPICLDKGLDLPGKVATAQVDFNVYHILLIKKSCVIRDLKFSFHLREFLELLLKRISHT